MEVTFFARRLVQGALWGSTSEVDQLGETIRITSSDQQFNCPPELAVQNKDWETIFIKLTRNGETTEHHLFKHMYGDVKCEPATVSLFLPNVTFNESVKVETKDEVKVETETNEEIKFEIIKEETKEENKEENKEETKEETNEETKEETREETKEETKEETREEPNIEQIPSKPLVLFRLKCAFDYTRSCLMINQLMVLHEMDCRFCGREIVETPNGALPLPGICIMNGEKCCDPCSSNRCHRCLRHVVGLTASCEVCGRRVCIDCVHNRFFSYVGDRIVWRTQCKCIVGK